MVHWCSRQQIDSAVAGMKCSGRIRPSGEKERDGFFLKASPKLNERWKWERHNGSQTMYHRSVFFFSLANEVTFIQSLIISYPFLCRLKRKTPTTYREAKHAVVFAVSLFAIFNLVCGEGNIQAIRIQTVRDRGDDAPALLSEVRGPRRRGVLRDYKCKWRLNGRPSDLFLHRASIG